MRTSKLTEEERAEKKRTYQRNYARSDKRKAARRRYNQSARGKEKNNAQCIRWRIENRDKYLASLYKADLKRHYGLTPESYNKMLEDQGSACAACQTTTPEHGVWNIDHCHTTGLVRGILCPPCNRALGHANDDANRLRALITYLERSHAGI